MRARSRHALAIAVLFATACSPVRASVPASPPRGAVRITPAESADCMRPTRRFTSDELPPPDAIDDAQAAELASVPPPVRRTIRALALEQRLASLLRAHRDDPSGRSVDLVAARLQVVMRISSVEIELDSLLFEADCTGDQMEAALRELDRLERRQVLALTIASIAVGAATGIAAGVLDARGNAPGAAIGGIGIGGGLATAGLGIGALMPRRGRVSFPHARNLFVPIADGDDPQQLYPPAVFRLLAAPRDADAPTPREELLAQWNEIIDEAIPERDRPLAREVLFGTGGLYDARLLDVRERMYDVLESQLNALDRDIEQLYGYFAIVLGDQDGPAAPG
ncbi:MAG: hypothetical protein K1X88_18020 [Nannocystaceae bacterium]|nr:hypothetical protein [Nannocystaceae bacterium]